MRFIHSLIAAIGSSLKLKLSLFIVVILGLTIGIAPWSAIKMQERQLLRASQDRLRALHAMLTKTIITTCMLTGSEESVQQVVEATSNHHDVAAVRLFDAKGVIRFSSKPAERGRQLAGAELTQFYGHPDPIMLRDGPVPVQTLVQPLFNQPTCVSCHDARQKVLGVLQVSLSIGAMVNQLASLKRLAFVATAITLGVIAVGIWLSLTLLVDQPMQQLIDVMQRAEHGDLHTRAPVRNKDELGLLARHFNEMLARLDVAQQALERYHQEQLARADRLATIGEMAAAMAHEIRNPLTGISGVLSVLSRDFPPDDPRRTIVGQTQGLINRLNRSIEDMLHYSRPSEPVLHPIHLEDIVARAMSLLESEAHTARVRLVKAALDPPVTATVNADPYQMQQVLVNLILNAIQATPAGGQVTLRVSTDGAARGPQSVCVEIADTGKGMRADEAARAFHPFFSTKAQGTGLGLPIAKQIVEQHAGTISLQSEPGKGTRVRIALPVHREGAKAEG